MEQNGAQQGQSLFESQLPDPLPTLAVSPTPQAFPFQDEHFAPKRNVLRILFTKNMIPKINRPPRLESAYYHYLMSLPLSTVPLPLAHDSNDSHAPSKDVAHVPSEYLAVLHT